MVSDPELATLTPWMLDWVSPRIFREVRRAQNEKLKKHSSGQAETQGELD